MRPSASPREEIWNWLPGSYGLCTAMTSSISATWPNISCIADCTAGSVTPCSASNTIWPVWGEPLPSANSDSMSVKPAVDSKPSSEKSWR
jgi:hypothetical protein